MGAPRGPKLKDPHNLAGHFKPEEAGFLELPRQASEALTCAHEGQSQSRLRFAAWIIFCTWTKPESSSYRKYKVAQVSASLSDRLESSPGRSFRVQTALSPVWTFRAPRGVPGRDAGRGNSEPRCSSQAPKVQTEKRSTWNGLHDVLLQRRGRGSLGTLEDHAATPR